jgi:cold-inducible RNA-binding protein
MSIKLFVGSISWDTTDEKLKEHFSQAGEVISANVVTDRETGRSRGFGFVEFASDEDGKKAIDMFNEQELDGRKIFVNEARAKEEN